MPPAHAPQEPNLRRTVWCIGEPTPWVAFICFRSISSVKREKMRPCNQGSGLARHPSNTRLQMLTTSDPWETNLYASELFWGKACRSPRTPRFMIICFSKHPHNSNRLPAFFPMNAFKKNPLKYQANEKPEADLKCAGGFLGYQRAGGG